MGTMTTTTTAATTTTAGSTTITADDEDLDLHFNVPSTGMQVRLVASWQAVSSCDPPVGWLSPRTASASPSHRD